MDGANFCPRTWSVAIGSAVDRQEQRSPTLESAGAKTRAPRYGNANAGSSNGLSSEASEVRHIDDRVTWRVARAS